MKKRRMKQALLVLLVLVAGIILAGCQSMQTQTELNPVKDNWRRSYESAKYLQLLHPEAGGTQAVEGLDGLAADQVYQQYLKSFRGIPAGAGTTTLMGQ